MENIDFKELALKAGQIARDKKAKDTLVLDIKDLSVIADYLVITTAESTPQINAVKDEIAKTFKELEVYPTRIEGRGSNTWTVLDYGGIVIHIMSVETRKLFNLESIWTKAQNIIPPEQKPEPKKQTIKKSIKKPKPKPKPKPKKPVKKPTAKKPIKKAKPKPKPKTIAKKPVKKPKPKKPVKKPKPKPKK
jgi:ribosome-associated protein